MHKIILLVFIGILSFSGCKQKDSSTNTKIEAQFNVFDSLLEAEPFVDSTLLFSIRTPKDWITIDSNLIETLKTSITINDYKFAKILNGYISTEDSSMLIILDISKVNTNVFQQIRENYNTLFNANKEWINIQFQDFDHNCFKVEQYVMQNEIMVNFKLICYEKNSPFNQPKFELLYLLNRKEIEQKIKSIESSIGTLNCLTSKKNEL